MICCTEPEAGWNVSTEDETFRFVGHIHVEHGTLLLYMDSTREGPQPIGYTPSWRLVRALAPGRWTEVSRVHH